MHYAAFIWLSCYLEDADLRLACSPMGPGRPGNPLGPSSPFWPNIPCCPLGPDSPSLPCEKSKFTQSKHLYSDPHQLELYQIPVQKHSYLCVFSLMGFLCLLNPFQGYGVYPSSHGRVWFDAHIQTLVGDGWLRYFFSEGHFMGLSSIHQLSTPTHSCSGSTGDKSFSHHELWTG